MNVVVQASEDGRYPSCIYTHLPTMPEAWRSRTIPLPTLVAMSHRENELRVHDESMQQLFRWAHSDHQEDHKSFEAAIAPLYTAVAGIAPHEDPSLADEPLVSSGTVIVLIQLRVLKEFGFDPATDQTALYELRTAAMMHPDVPALQETVQFRFNRQGNPSDGTVVVGAIGPDCTLYNPCTLAATTLHHILRDLTQDARAMGGGFKHYPTVVLSGSYS